MPETEGLPVCLASGSSQNVWVPLPVTSVGLSPNAVFLS